MNRGIRKGILILFVVFALVVPTTVMANKKLYKAVITTGAELHQVVGSSARGSAVFNSNPDGSLHFILQIRNLSGAATGLHIHGPASAAETAGVLVTLCGGGPLPAVVSTCPFDSSNNSLLLDGTITSSILAQRGILPSDLQEWLDGSLIYVNVHTELNPAGEARGQLIPQ